MKELVDEVKQEIEKRESDKQQELIRREVERQLNAAKAAEGRVASAQSKLENALEVIKKIEEGDYSDVREEEIRFYDGNVGDFSNTVSVAPYYPEDYPRKRR
jgi:predicted Holliday junction resolvase-like endonuclease